MASSNTLEGIIPVILAMSAVSTGYKNGIDVSRYQGNVDWQKVSRAGISFAAAKATEGGTYQDPKFTQNWQGMRRNNIAPAAYHYFRGATASADQAENIRRTLQTVDFDKSNDILAIDVEARGNENVSADNMASTLDDLLRKLSSYNHVYIYCGPSYWENSVSWRKFDFSKYNLWISHYTSKSSPNIPTTWKDKGYTWWQHSQTGRVDGISGNVDLNKSN